MEASGWKVGATQPLSAASVRSLWACAQRLSGRRVAWAMCCVTPGSALHEPLTLPAKWKSREGSAWVPVAGMCAPCLLTLPRQKPRPPQSEKAPAAGARGVAGSCLRASFSTWCTFFLGWEVSADCYAEQPLPCLMGGQLWILMRSSASHLC